MLIAIVMKRIKKFLRQVKSIILKIIPEENNFVHSPKAVMTPYMFLSSFFLKEKKCIFILNALEIVIFLKTKAKTPQLTLKWLEEANSFLVMYFS